MKRLLPFVPILIALAGAASVTSPPVVAQSRATATNVPVIPHEAVPNFFKNPPGIYTGENMGIATNSKGNIYIYHRAYETRLFEVLAAGHVHPRDRPQQLRLRLRPRGPRRRGRQRLDDRRGLEHPHQVHPGGQAADGDRQAPGSDRPAREDAGSGPTDRAPTARIRSASANRHRLGPGGQHLRERRVLSTRGSSSTTRTAASSSRRHARQRPTAGVRHARTRWPSTPTGTSTSATAATRGSWCWTRT